jgi:hypothetical protein
MKLIPSTAESYAGPIPQACDICHAPITVAFVDGKTAFGPWANMCPSCHRDNGGKLGTGLGQQYEFQQGIRWAKMVPASEAKPRTSKKPPSMRTLEKWSMDGVAKATDGCRVEPDGTCPHGAQSWLLKMGLV